MKLACAVSTYVKPLHLKLIQTAVALLGLASALHVEANTIPGLSPVTLVTASEFYYAPLDYYFLTSRDTEKAQLSNVSGWSATGRSFDAYSAPVAGTTGVSRYFFDKIAKNNTRGSHFYTELDSDRETLAALNPTNAQTARLPYFEGNDSFALPPIAAGVGGTCPAGTNAVYRAFRGNARFPDDPNHVFTADLTRYQQLVSLGWDGEGVNFCVPTTISDTAGCPQKGYFPDVSARANYIDKNLDGKTSWDTNASLQPSVTVSCANGVVSVASNGVPNFDSVGIGLAGANAPYQTNSRVWRFPQQPTAAAQPRSLRNTLGPIAIMINGVQIYGPVEAPMDNYADPYKAGLLNYCGGHVSQFHFHAFPECFFNQKTLTGSTTLLPAKTPGVVLGYAFDGYPILAPYEYCYAPADATCVNGVREIKSAYRYVGTGNYPAEGAFDFNTYTAGYNGSTLDSCNGKADTAGNYAYYATRQFPYFLACYHGTATTQQ
jgi:YHYH protein/Repeat of unknown function (DUF5648)